ncbi:hypothetical protein GE061_000949 [Apolygus lucorum]|uniref:Uncharacterized protein n=1 Tax=Apolygus lucorum TaxID=248454 RepID=A0A8S9YB49_APOLU|nr:hypothetical protein GE061_000949 [Apolygus lucorum]
MSYQSRASAWSRASPSDTVMLGKLLVVVGVVRELSCEWVELPKLKPWSMEPDRQLTTGGPAVHLIRHDMVEAPGVQVLDGANTRRHTGAISSEKEKVNFDSNVAATEADISYLISEGTTWHSMTSTESNQAVINRGNESMYIDSIRNPFTSSKPSLVDWDSLAEHEISVKERSDLPGHNQPPPTATNNEDRFPNRSYTYLDPLIESLMLKVHHTLISQAGQPIKHKIHYLQTLQNNIMNQIWKRSQRLWVMEGPEARSNDMVGFPSLEGALLTISFLTFAVFLIRIVRQFIQGVQGTNSTVIDLTGTGVRHKRDLLSSQTVEILKMMEEYHLQHSCKLDTGGLIVRVYCEWLLD